LLLEYAQRSGRPADLRAATDTLTAVVADDPNNPELRLQLGVAYALAGNDAAARDEFERAHDLAPDDPAPLENLGHLGERGA
jgi:Flp pilus assembly protein TadD